MLETTDPDGQLSKIFLLLYSSSRLNHVHYFSQGENGTVKMFLFIKTAALQVSAVGTFQDVTSTLQENETCNFSNFAYFLKPFCTVGNSMDTLMSTVNSEALILGPAALEKCMF